MKLATLYIIISFLCSPFVFSSCEKDDDDSNAPTTTNSNSNSNSNCDSEIVFDQSRGACDQTLNINSSFNINVILQNRTFTANNIPDHKVGKFGQGSGSLNPNAIKAQSETYVVPTDPVVSANFTALLGPNGPDYSFGILLNGVELDPVAAEPFPHQGIMDPNVNWDWNLEALNTNLGLDCNSAHVQPNGAYHYHGPPTLYLQNANIPSNQMTLVGYAADGFPIYYKYAYQNANDDNTTVIEMTSSYRLKQGDRPGDGITAPCDSYTGVYSNDYEYVSGLGTLDKANGRNGVTPEYPGGTYYYIITDDFPAIPRYFKGTPSSDFSI